MILCVSWSPLFTKKVQIIVAPMNIIREPLSIKEGAPRPVVPLWYSLIWNCVRRDDTNTKRKKGCEIQTGGKI